MGLIVTSLHMYITCFDRSYSSTLSYMLPLISFPFLAVTLTCVCAHTQWPDVNLGYQSSLSVFWDGIFHFQLVLTLWVITPIRPAFYLGAGIKRVSSRLHSKRFTDWAMALASPHLPFLALVFNILSVMTDTVLKVSKEKAKLGGENSCKEITACWRRSLKSPALKICEALCVCQW